MGNENSQFHAPSSYSKQLSAKELKKLEKKILSEYPFLSSVNESMLVTDNQLPDCPIIFANDSFEKMTLYPQEEIIGFNCRFLQGRHTNRRTVKKIKEAVVNGQSLDVEILNYRKNGQPFLNNFLLLPIHCNPKLPKFATHFIAIQKDVTYICKQQGNVKDWLPIQLALYLEEVGCDEFVMPFIENNINGDSFLKLDHQQLIDIGISSPSTRIKILELSSSLLSNPSPHLLVATDFLDHTSQAESDSPSISSESSEDYSLSSDVEGIVLTTSSSTPRQINHWKSHNPNSAAIKEKNVAIKFFYRGAIEVFIVSRSISLKKLIKKAKRFSKLTRLSLEAETLNASRVLITSSLQLTSLLGQETGTLHITIRQKLKKKYNKKRSAIALPNLTISLQNNAYALRASLFDELQPYPSIQYYSSIPNAHAYPSALPSSAASDLPDMSTAYNSFSSVLSNFDCFVCPCSFFGDVGESLDFYTSHLLSNFEEKRSIIDELHKTIDEKYEGEIGAAQSILIYRSNYYFLFIPFCRSLDDIHLADDYLYLFMRCLLLTIHKYNRKLSSLEVNSSLANSKGNLAKSSSTLSISQIPLTSRKRSKKSPIIDHYPSDLPPPDNDDDKPAGDMNDDNDDDGGEGLVNDPPSSRPLSSISLSSHGDECFSDVSSKKNEEEDDQQHDQHHRQHDNDQHEEDDQRQEVDPPTDKKRKVKEKKRFLINNVFVPSLAIDNLFIKSSGTAMTIPQNIVHIAHQTALAYSSFVSHQSNKLRSSFITNIQTSLTAHSLYYSPSSAVSSEKSKNDKKDMNKSESKEILQSPLSFEIFVNYISSGSLCVRGIGSTDELNLLIQLAHGTNQKYKNDRRLQHMASTSLLSLFTSRQFHIHPSLKKEIAKGIMSSSECIDRIMAQSSSSSITAIVPFIPSNQFSILSVLGSGASGFIYLISYQKKKRVLKAFHDIGNTTEYFRELTIMSFIDHENLMKVIGSGRLDDGRYFYITEYYERGSLFKVIHASQSPAIDSPASSSLIAFNIRSQINVLIDIAKAMSYLHSISFIHRDLKSMNVLITNDDRAIVIDFGTARKMDSTMTDNVGTVAWMAPEIFISENYTNKVDVYSYGMIIYELLTRQVPFADRKSFQITPLVLKGERPHLPPNAPKLLSRLCEKCWHQKPAKRPSFDDILSTLSSYSHHSSFANVNVK